MEMTFKLFENKWLNVYFYGSLIWGFTIFAIMMGIGFSDISDNLTIMTYLSFLPLVLCGQSFNISRGVTVFDNHGKIFKSMIYFFSFFVGIILLFPVFLLATKTQKDII